jgi:hypothetical protein
LIKINISSCCSLWKKLFVLLVCFGWEVFVEFGLHWNKFEEDVWTWIEGFEKRLFLSDFGYLNKSVEEEDGEVEDILNWKENREDKSLLFWCCCCCSCCYGGGGGDCDGWENIGEDGMYWFIVLLVVLLRRGELIGCCLNWRFCGTFELFKLGFGLLLLVGLLPKGP